MHGVNAESEVNLPDGVTCFPPGMLVAPAQATIRTSLIGPLAFFAAARNSSAVRFAVLARDKAVLTFPDSR